MVRSVSEHDHLRYVATTNSSVNNLMLRDGGDTVRQNGVSGSINYLFFVFAQIRFETFTIGAILRLVKPRRGGMNRGIEGYLLHIVNMNRPQPHRVRRSQVINEGKPQSSACPQILGQSVNRFVSK